MPKIIFTEDQKKAMRELREVFGLGWDEIGRRFNACHTTVRCAIDTEYAAFREQYERKRKPRTPRKDAYVHLDKVSVPQVVADRRWAYLNAPYRSLASQMLGEPPIGFSALDRKQASA